MLPALGRRRFQPELACTPKGAARVRALDGARARVAAALGGRPREIVFTGSGTEADNLAIAGVAEARGAGGATW